MLRALRCQLSVLSIQSRARAGVALATTTLRGSYLAGNSLSLSTTSEASSSASQSPTNNGSQEEVTPIDSEQAGARVIKTVKRGVRYSPRKLTLLAQQIRGLTATEALLQMKFSRKRKAEIVRKTVQNAVNLADIKYQIEPTHLRIDECFVNKGQYLKRLRIMGRGNAGVMHHPHSHLTVILREFDPATKPLSRFKAKMLARAAKNATAQESAASAPTQS